MSKVEYSVRQRWRRRDPNREFIEFLVDFVRMDFLVNKVIGLMTVGVSRGPNQ